MKRCLTNLVLIFCCFLQKAIANQNSVSCIYLGSREADPASLVENVSTIHGDYTEVEVDLIAAAPDSLVLSRFYSSRDSVQTANFGGWRFNPHCFLSIQNDPKGKSYRNAEGKFERNYVYIGNPDGTILTYVGWQNTTNLSKRVLFTIDPEEEVLGLSNTAKGNINCWTNLKNNELYFDPQTNSFELFLSSEGKRFYSKHPSLDGYFITQEILPSGNKVFYEFDEKGQLSFIRETNASEKKVLAWIKIGYENEIHIETSDGKTADYRFQQDPSGIMLLTEVIRSDKPNLAYQYQVIEDQVLLTKKVLPEERFVEVEYYSDEPQKNKVRSVTTPTGTQDVACVFFSYEDNYTEVDGPGESKTVYQFDDDYQLIAIEQYLEGSLYRTHRKTWGRRSDAGNLISTSVEDADGNVFYYKQFVYDSQGKGNIVEEKEYGDVIGLGPVPLVIDENGLVTNQDGHIKNYAYFSGKNTHGFFQTDAKGTGVKYWYKKGTNLLLKKFILTRGSPDSEEEDWDSGIHERHFYAYNEDAALIQVTIDDGKEETIKDTYGVTERTITYVFPKQELPNVGVPEVIEQKYVNGKSEFLLKKTVNQFDNQGNVISQAIYDEDDHHCYTLIKRYEHGLLVLDTDPLGNETHYSYDANQNLTSETHSNTDVSIEYGYDLRNRLIYILEKDSAGNRFETHMSHDSSGNKLSERDRFGNETVYVYDSLGRVVQITYPETKDGIHSTIIPSYTYTYDLFDNPISVTDPKGRTLARSYNVHGKPIEINHLDGTKEILKYDNGGNLRRYYRTDGLLQVFAYDYKGRLDNLQYFRRESKDYPFKEKTYSYGTFHKTSEKDERGNQTIYTYGPSGRLRTLKKDDQTVEFIYDALGRTHGVKKWKSTKTFTLEIKEYDLLNRVIEERIEDQNSKVLLKKRYVYNDAGYLEQVIGYPQNEQSVLLRYEYDGLGRIRKETNGAGHATTITYDDAYINEWGQKTEKRTLIDPMGNQSEEIFDWNGRLIKLIKKDQAGQILANSEFFYDYSGNQIAQRAWIFSADAPSSVYETEWSLNQADQVELFTLGKETPQERTIRFTYDSYGDIAAKYTPGFKEPIIYQYNIEGNLDKLSYKEGKKEIDYKFTYDHHQNITKVSLDSSFTLTYSFNAHDMPLTEKTQDEFGSYQVGLIYDGEGKIQTLQLPDGSSVEYLYEGPFVKEAKRFSKDKKQLYNHQVASRDLMGNILEEILPGHLGGRKQLWDQAGRRIEISTDFLRDRVLEDGYDSLENIIKRETILDDETFTFEYGYNALAQLILEKGEIKHSYAYDSIGNRLYRDDSGYKIDGVNQLIEAEGAIYTFDPNGNLATKTIGNRVWTYEINYLNQITCIKDPDENVVKFTYAPSGKRLSKRIEAKNKKAKIFRFFYLEDTEIGCVDEKGVITELKIPGNPNHPEAPSIAIEIKKEIYVPLYDLQGNITCLLDHQRRKVVETYRYSVYGEERIVNARGKVLSDSSLGNPWRYRGKRVDKEVGLIYFGYRYYDPELGRWTSPDPAGTIDGPNLYAYARNNPMKYVDYFGFFSDVNEGLYPCSCGYCERGEFCHCMGSDPTHDIGSCGCLGISCIHKRRGSMVLPGGSIISAICGISHGVVDFAIGTIHGLQTAAAYLGAEQLELSLEGRIQAIVAIEQSQANQMAAVEGWMMDMLSIDESDAVYDSFRSTTTLGLEIGSLVTGVYGGVKGVMAFNRMAKMPSQVTRLARSTGTIESFVNRGTSFAGRKRFQLDYAPYQTIRNESTIINGRKYTGHALDRMQDRGFMPSAIENTINTGRVAPANFTGGLEYYDSVNKVRVITGENGQIITIIPGRG